MQKKMLTFNAKMEECEGCDEKWNMPNTLDMWYERFHEYSYEGGCDEDLLRTNPVVEKADYVVPSETFYSELSKFLSDNCGRSFAKNLVYTGDIKTSDFKITGWRQTISVKSIDEISTQGP